MPNLLITRKRDAGETTWPPKAGLAVNDHARSCPDDARRSKLVGSDAGDQVLSEVMAGKAVSDAASAQVCRKPGLPAPWIVLRGLIFTVWTSMLDLISSNKSMIIRFVPANLGN